MKKFSNAVDMRSIARTVDLYIQEHGIELSQESDCFEYLCVRMESLLLFEEVSQWDLVQRVLETPSIKYNDLFNKQLDKRVWTVED